MGIRAFVIGLSHIYSFSIDKMKSNITLFGCLLNYIIRFTRKF